jgi:hypothetical protein
MPISEEQTWAKRTCRVRIWRGRTCSFKAVLDGADLQRAFLYGAQFLNCAQLIVTRNWQSAFRDDALAFGASIPEKGPSE